MEKEIKRDDQGLLNYNDNDDTINNDNDDKTLEMQRNLNDDNGGVSQRSSKP